MRITAAEFSDMSAETVDRTCPECGHALTENKGCRTWCVECEWNLDAPYEPRREGFVRGWLDRRSARMVEALYAEVSDAEVLRPGWDLARFGSYALALGVHAFSLATVVATVALAMLFPRPLSFLAIILAIVAFAIRPRFGRLTDDEYILSRSDAPRLHGLCDRIADELHAKPVDAIVIAPAFNAAYTTIGVRRRRVLILGLPLWNALSPQQRVALIAHELAHGVNGDARHGLVVGSALAALAELHNLMRPDAPGSPTELEGLPGVLLRFLQWIVRSVAGVVFAAQLAMMLRASQRAEYLADELSAQVASTEAMATALDKINTTRSAFDYAARTSAARTYAGGGSLWENQRRALAELPELELERRRRVAARQSLRVDDSHPPTHLRIAFVRARSDHAATVTLDSADAQAIEAELAPAYESMATEIRYAVQHGYSYR